MRTAGASTDTYTYSPTSNRIASITPSSGPVKSFVFDPNGSTIADGANTYTYDVRGRMVPLEHLLAELIERLLGRRRDIVVLRGIGHTTRASSISRERIRGRGPWL